MSDDNRRKATDLLDWLGYRAVPDFARGRALGGLIGFLLSALILLAVLAALLVLFQTIGQAISPSAAGLNLGAGALITALLGGPFVIWGTWLKHRTVRTQQEGHMTDRITKAVEQLGAEKKVDRIGRSVTIWTGKPETISVWLDDIAKHEQLARTTVGEKQWHEYFDEKTEEVVSGYECDVTTWPAERTVIEYTGEPPKLANRERIGLESEWKVFSETVPNIEVRIGAILSLERIAQDSTIYDKGRDHVRVMEILCAYVRQNAPGTSARKSLRERFEEMREGTADAPGLTEQQIAYQQGSDFIDKAKDLDHLCGWAVALPPPRADVALALRVIGRRTAEQRRVEAAWPEPPDEATVWPFDLPCPSLPDKPDETPLSRAALAEFRQRLAAWRRRIVRYKGYRLDLSSTNLQRADLAAKHPDALDAVFAGALLTAARVEGADLSRARMEGTNLAKARMGGANLTRARMEGMNLTGARMEGADLFDARMKAVSLIGARMEGVKLIAARMEGASLIAARMEGANLTRAQLEGVDLRGARMQGAYLYRARMDQSTSLNAAEVSGAVARNVDWSKVGWVQEQINSLFGDASVILRTDRVRPGHWPVWELPFGGDHDFDSEWRKWQEDPAGYVPPPPPEPKEEENAGSAG
jgi:uncharacterized protein YjbI with pentapeptide repeats